MACVVRVNRRVGRRFIAAVMEGRSGGRQARSSAGQRKVVCLTGGGVDGLVEFELDDAQGAARLFAAATATVVAAG
jgi:hypothetical protein